MMNKNASAVPGWLPFVDLVCVTVACTLWFAWPSPWGGRGLWPLALAMIPWLARLVLVGRPTLRTRFDLSLLLFLLTAAISVWAAYDRQVAWSKFWLIVGGILLFYALVNARSTGTARVWLLAIAGVGLAGFFLATHNWDLFPAEIEILARVGRGLQRLLPSLPGSPLNPNEVAGILATLIPFVGWLVFRTGQGLRGARGAWGPARWLALALALGALILMLFGLLMTLSRGAWLALAAALLCAGLWAMAGRLSGGRPAKRGWIFAGGLLLLLVVAGGLGLLWAAQSVAPANGLFSLDTWLSRGEFQRNSLILARDYPIIGAGLDGFQMLYSSYVMLLHVGFIPHSHNMYLGIAIDQGLLGLAALLWMWVLFGSILWRLAFGSSGIRQRVGVEAQLVGVAAMSLLVILLHSFVDYAFYGRGVLFLFVPLAFVAAIPLPERAQPVWRRALIPLICIALVLGLAMVRPQRTLSRIYSNLGAVHQSQAELSVYVWPEWSVQDAVRRAVDLGRPVSEFKRALSLDPRNPTANRRLGMIELSLGEYEDALLHLEAAYAVEPESVTTRQLLGEALIVNGRVEEGRVLWAGVSNDQKQLNLRAFWYETIEDTGRVEWIRKAAAGR